MIRSQHKEGRQCDTTGERRFQKTEPINEDLTPASTVVSGFPAYKAPEKSGLATFTRMTIMPRSRAARTEQSGEKRQDDRVDDYRDFAGKLGFRMQAENPPASGKYDP